MANAVYLVVPNKVLHTGKFSFTFMEKAKVPMDWWISNRHYGWLTLDVDGLWYIYIFHLGHKTHTEKGMDSPDNNALKTIIKSIPDSILLIQMDFLDRFIAVCKEMGVRVETHYYKGLLQTHYERVEI